MTQLLQQAWAEVQKRTEDEQDFIAAIVLEELGDENLWQDKFAKSQAQLTKLAEKVRTDIQAGRVRQVGVDEL
jgi:hypothetical protein